MTIRFYGFGINDYPGKGSDLNGCVNDIILARRVIMKKFGLTPGYVHCRFDKRATLAAYRQKMHHAVDFSVPGDTVILWNSSHGTRIPDRNGDEVNDQLDEAIVPHDFETNGFLIDDEVGGWLASFAEGVRVVMVLDCCYSGTMSRDNINRPSSLGGSKCVVPVNTIKTRTMLPPKDVLLRTSGEAEEYRATPAKPFLGDSGLDGAIILSASQPHQTASDAYFPDADGGGGAYQGAFSYALCNALNGSDTTYASVISETERLMKSWGFVQVPYFECSDSLKDLPFGK